MLTYKLKALVTTMVSTTTAPLSATPLSVPLTSLIAVDSTGVVYIGDSDVDSTHGFKLPNTPMPLGQILHSGHDEFVDLSRVYVKGAAGSEVVRVLYPVPVNIG